MVSPEGRWTVDVPVYEGIKGYAQTYLRCYENLTRTINTPELDPINIYYQVIALISLIPNKDESDKIIELMEGLKSQLTEKYKKEYDVDKLTEKQKNHILITSSLRTITYVQMYVDKMYGLNEFNKVGFVIGNNIELSDKEIEEDLKIEEEKDENS